MMTPGRLAAGMVAIALTIGAHGVAFASNVGKIFGTWIPVRYTPNPQMDSGIKICNAKMVFTPKTQSVWMGIHPDWGVTPLPVTYLDRPNTVVGVYGNTGRPVTYRFIDPNHIIDIADMDQCIYERR